MMFLMSLIMRLRCQCGLLLFVCLLVLKTGENQICTFPFIT